MTMAFINGKIDGTNKTYDVTKADTSRHISGELTIAGNNEADKVCNIYDLEGNAREFVAEKNTYNSISPFVGRGGSYNNSNSASYRLEYRGTLPYSIASFRSVLYVMWNWTLLKPILKNSAKMRLQVFLGKLNLPFMKLNN